MLGGRKTGTVKMRRDESQNVEYKRSWHDDYLRGVCGFANGKGGTIWIGIDDDKSVYGVDKSKKLMEDIPNKIKDTIVQELDILNVPSDRRNGILADVFDRLDYMEREGSGFKKIVEDYTANVVHNTAKVMPKFYSAVGCFIVTLPRLSHRGQWCTPGEGATPIATPITTPKATQMAKSLGLTRDGIRYHLGRMKVAGVIHFVGSERTGHWEEDEP